MEITPKELAEYLELALVKYCADSRILTPPIVPVTQVERDDQAKTLDALSIMASLATNYRAKTNPKIALIRLHRFLFGSTLKEAKEAVDQLLP